MVEQCAGDDADVEINLGCLLYKVEIIGSFCDIINGDIC
jgi:hypothetical protein